MYINIAIKSEDTHLSQIRCCHHLSLSWIIHLQLFNSKPVRILFHHVDRSSRFILPEHGILLVQVPKRIVQLSVGGPYILLENVRPERINIRKVFFFRSFCVHREPFIGKYRHLETFRTVFAWKNNKTYWKSKGLGKYSSYLFGKLLVDIVKSHVLVSGG